MLVWWLANWRFNSPDDTIFRTDVWQAEKTTVTVTLDVSLGVQQYKSTVSQIERQSAFTTTNPHIEKRPVLGQQKAKPDNWIHVTLKGQGRSRIRIF